MTTVAVENQENTVKIAMTRGDMITIEIHGGKGVRLFEAHMDRDGNTELRV